MSRRPATARSSVELMCSKMRTTSTRSDRTLRFYREELAAVIKCLERGDRHTLPWEITEEDVVWLLHDYEDRNLTVSTRRGYVSALRTWTKWYGNDLLDRMEIRWPQDMRPNVDWISEDQARRLLEIPKTPVQELLIHCELCLGMRRIEVMRLKVDSFKGSFVEIIGKGAMGGKPRCMPYHRDTGRILERYMTYRNALIALVQSKRCGVEVPDTLLIYAKGSKLHEYTSKGSGLDEMIKPLSKEIGAKFSHHTLRRTFGRTMYRSGVPPATISKMMGHESIDQTLKYIGVDMDDMTSAMTSFLL